MQRNGEGPIANTAQNTVHERASALVFDLAWNPAREGCKKNGPTRAASSQRLCSFTCRASNLAALTLELPGQTEVFLDALLYSSFGAREAGLVNGSMLAEPLHNKPESSDRKVSEERAAPISV